MARQLALILAVAMASISSGCLGFRASSANESSLSLGQSGTGPARFPLSRAEPELGLTTDEIQREQAAAKARSALPFELPADPPDTYADLYARGKPIDEMPDDLLEEIVDANGITEAVAQQAADVAKAIVAKKIDELTAEAYRWIAGIFSAGSFGGIGLAFFLRRWLKKSGVSDLRQWLDQFGSLGDLFDIPDRLADVEAKAEHAEAEATQARQESFAAAQATNSVTATPAAPTAAVAPPPAAQPATATRRPDSRRRSRGR